MRAIALAEELRRTWDRIAELDERAETAAAAGTGPDYAAGGRRAGGAP